MLALKNNFNEHFPLKMCFLLFIISYLSIGIESAFQLPREITFKLCMLNWFHQNKGYIDLILVERHILCIKNLDCLGLSINFTLKKTKKKNRTSSKTCTHEMPHYCKK